MAEKQKGIKAKLDKFLSSIAKQNQDTFGDQKLDCCGLNSQKKASSK